MTDHPSNESSVQSDFAFFVHPEDIDSAAAGVRVQWCISKRMSEALADMTNPYVGVVVFDESGKEKRYVFSLFHGNGEGYIQFRTAGKHYIHAGVLSWGVSNFMLKDRFIYSIEVVSYEDRLLPPAQRTMTSQLFVDEKIVSMEWDVATNRFEKEPPAWLAWWVDLFHDESFRTLDSCTFRSRLLFDWVWKIPLILAVIVLSICGVIVYYAYQLLAVFLHSILLLRRDVNYSVLILDDEPARLDSAYREAKDAGSLITMRADNSERIPKEYGVLFTPIFNLIALGLSWGCTILYNPTETISLYLVYVAIVTISVTVLFLLNKIEHWESKTSEKDKEAARKRVKVREEHLKLAKFSPLVCVDGSGAPKPKLTEAPSAAITRLYYSGKARICRPFAAR